MKVLRDLVLIKADKPREKTKSGLLVYEQWKTIPPMGTIIELGPKVRLVYTNDDGTTQIAKVGDRVIFERYGSVILPDDQRMCKASHIMAVITAEDEIDEPA